MKLIIAGSRSLSPSVELIGELLRQLIPDFRGFHLEVVSGTARGVDRAGEEYAEMTYADLTKFPADWDTHGKKAGFIRNREMAEYADALLLIWDGESKGSANMKELMIRKKKKPVYLAILRGGRE